MRRARLLLLKFLFRFFLFLYNDFLNNFSNLAIWSLNLLDPSNNIRFLLLLRLRLLHIDMLHVDILVGLRGMVIVVLVLVGVYVLLVVWLAQYELLLLLLEDVRRTLHHLLSFPARPYENFRDFDAALLLNDLLYHLFLLFFGILHHGLVLQVGQLVQFRL